MVLDGFYFVLCRQFLQLWKQSGQLNGIPHIRAGTLKAIASGGRERSPALPEVPTFSESGVPGYEAVSWIGMFAPQGTDTAIVEHLAAAVKSAMQEQDVKDILLRDGSEVAVSTPTDFRGVVAGDYAKYGKFANLFKKSQ